MGKGHILTRYRMLGTSDAQYRALVRVIDAAARRFYEAEVGACGDFVGTGPTS